MKYYYELINGESGTFTANNDKKALKFLMKKYGKGLLSIYDQKFTPIFERKCYAN